MSTAFKSTALVSVVLQETDVILGKSAGSQCHPGNRRYRQICRSAASWYHADRDNVSLKRIVIRRVMLEVVPGRFLKQFAEGYVVVRDREAYTKIQTDLRTSRLGRMLSKASRERIPAMAHSVLSRIVSSGTSIESSQPNSPETTTLKPDEGHDAAINPATSASARFSRNCLVETRALYNGATMNFKRPARSQPPMKLIVPPGAIDITGRTPQSAAVNNSHRFFAFDRSQLEAEFVALSREKELLVLRNKVLALKHDITALLGLSCGEPRRSNDTAASEKNLGQTPKY